MSSSFEAELSSMRGDTRHTHSIFKRLFTLSDRTREKNDLSVFVPPCEFSPFHVLLLDVANLPGTKERTFSGSIC